MYGFQQQKNNLVKGLVNLTQGKNKQATKDLSNCPKLLDLGDKKRHSGHCKYKYVQRIQRNCALNCA